MLCPDYGGLVDLHTMKSVLIHGSLQNLYAKVPTTLCTFWNAILPTTPLSFVLSLVVKGWMDDLAKYGRYQVDEQTLSKIREIFVSGHCDNADTFEEIYRVYDACGYVMDPHTAVGSYVLRQLQLKEKCVLLSTASPYKFTRDVLKALKEQPSDDDFVCMEQLSDYAKTVIPQGLYSLKDKEERFSDVISCEKMDAYVEEKTKELLV